MIVRRRATQRDQFMQIGKVIFCTAVLGMAPVVQASADPPAIQVGTRQHTWKDLYGVTLQELRAEFDAGVKNLPIAHLQKLPALCMSLDIQEVVALRKEEDRNKLVAAFWKAHTRGLVADAARVVVLAYLTDGIVKAHGVNLSDYYDPAPLRDACKRDQKLLEFFWKHRNDLPEKEAEVAAEAVSLYGSRITPDLYSRSRKMIDDPPRPEFMRNRQGELFRCLDRTEEDYSLKAFLLADLIREACEEGVYYTKVQTLFHASGATVDVFELKDFRGDREALQKYFSRVIGKDGDVAAGGLRELREWLSTCGHGDRLKHNHGLGAFLLTGGAPGQTTKTGGVGFAVNARVTALPANGKVYEIAPNTFRVCAVLLKMPKNPQDYAAFYKSRAYPLAIAPYLPTVKTFLDGWSLTAEDAVKTVLDRRVPERFASVKVENYVKKPYPGTFFAEWEEYRDQLDEIAVRAANLAIEPDGAAAAKLVAEIKQRSEKLKTPPVRKAYLDLANRLSEKLKLPKE
jgi:hypothetical protein